MKKTKIVPNIFALDKETFEKKLKILDFAKHIHLDYMDGEFVGKSSVTLFDMVSIKEVTGKVFDLHMMAYRPFDYISKISELGIRRVYVQFEVYCSDEKISKDILGFKKEGIEIGIVLNPATPALAIESFLGHIDAVMVMSVWPGEEGQSFMPETLSKIAELRDLGFRGEIAFDGGVNMSNVDILVDHGANVLYVGSAVSSSENAKKSYEELKDRIR